MNFISTNPADLAYLAELTEAEFEAERIRLVSAELAAMPAEHQVTCSRLQAACNKVHDATRGNPLAALEVLMPQLRTLSSMLPVQLARLENSL